MTITAEAWLKAHQNCNAVDNPSEKINEAAQIITDLQTDLNDYHRTMLLIHEAGVRATKMYNEKHGTKIGLNDTAQSEVFLMEENDRLRAELKEYEEAQTRDDAAHIMICEKIRLDYKAMFDATRALIQQITPIFDLKKDENPVERIDPIELSNAIADCYTAMKRTRQDV